MKNLKEANLSISGKNILITGASRGIGRTLSIELSKLGANIILLSKNESLLENIYDEISDKTETDPSIIGCDLNLLDEPRSQEISNIISDNYIDLDCIIHNAAIIEKMSNIEEYDLVSWEKVMKVNLTSSFLLTKFLLPNMENAKNPRIIFTSSSVAFKGKAFWGAYSASKAGMKVLSEILSDELEHKKNFKVFNFNPMATRTDMRAMAFPAEDPNQLKEAMDLMPYYIWMLSDKSKDFDKINLNYGDKI